MLKFPLPTSLFKLPAALSDSVNTSGKPVWTCRLDLGRCPPRSMRCLSCGFRITILRAGGSGLTQDPRIKGSVRPGPGPGVGDRAPGLGPDLPRWGGGGSRGLPVTTEVHENEHRVKLSEDRFSHYALKKCEIPTRRQIWKFNALFCWTIEQE